MRELSLRSNWLTKNSEKSETRPTGGSTASPAGQPALSRQMMVSEGMMVFKGETAAGLALALGPLALGDSSSVKEMPDPRSIQLNASPVRSFGRLTSWGRSQIRGAATGDLRRNKIRWPVPTVTLVAIPMVHTSRRIRWVLHRDQRADRRHPDWPPARSMEYQKMPCPLCRARCAMIGGSLWSQRQTRRVRPRGSPTSSCPGLVQTDVPASFSSSPMVRVPLLPVGERS
jgi:hypothetical protein